MSEQLDFQTPTPRKDALESSWSRWAEKETWVDSAGVIAERAYMAGYFAGIGFAWKQRHGSSYQEGYRDGREAGRIEAEQEIRDLAIEDFLREERHAAFE